MSLFVHPVYQGLCFAEQRETQRSKQRQREESDLLNIECCHSDDVIDVGASANLLHVRQVPFRNTQSHTHTQTHKTGQPLAYQLFALEYQLQYFMKAEYNTIHEKYRLHRSQSFLSSCKVAKLCVYVYCPDLQMMIRNLSSSRARFCCSGSKPSEAFWTHCRSWWRKTCRMLSGRSVNTGGTSSGLETQEHHDQKKQDEWESPLDRRKRCLQYIPCFGG